MKREMTWGVVGALAIAASVGISLQPGGSNRGKENAGVEHRAIPRHGHSKSTSALPSPDAAHRLACDDLAEAFELFLYTPKPISRPPSCLGDQPAGALFVPSEHFDNDLNPQDPVDVHLEFVVATLPDPVHTHLPLLFDRLTEVIQEAAQDEQFIYETSWLPWEDKEEEHALLTDDDEAEDRKEKRERQPGILLFRRNPLDAEGKDQAPSTAMYPYQDGLFVFVVGEDPTRGIHLEQFHNAIEWIDKLRHFDSTKSARVAILGPTFSGSFASLKKVLTAGESGTYLTKNRTNDGSKLPIYSGTANSRKSIADFTSFSDSGTKLGIEFQNFLEFDEVGLERYCRFVNKANGYDKTDGFSGSQNIAVISEDETAFGNSPSESSPDHELPCLHQALWLYYPRDISALRAAYQTNSVFNATAPQQLSDVGRGSLPSNIADPEGKEHDTIRSYAGQQTPLSQEAYLLGLVNAMREHHTEYVILRSTNALDQIFLARYLRRGYPDARIVIDGADRLFERERGSTGMGGAMSLSTYPLLERERDWIDPPSEGPSGSATKSQVGHRSFNSDFSEGTYIALRMLLNTAALNDGKIGHPAACALVSRRPIQDLPTIVGSLPDLDQRCQAGLRLPIPDYGAPAWAVPGCLDPKVGTNCESLRAPATWLSVIGQDGFWAIAALNEKTFNAKTSDKAPAKGELGPEVPLSLKILFLFLLLFSGFHAWCCASASFTAKPALRTHFANPCGRRHTFLVFLGSLFAAMLPLFAGWACGVFDRWATVIYDPRWVWSVRIAVVLAVLTALAGTLLNLWQVKKLATGSHAPHLEGLNLVLTIVAVCAGSLLGVGIFFAVYAWPLQGLLISANRFFTYYRSMHILSGVSPILPFIALAIGMYLWFWYALHGLALFGADRCRLPSAVDLKVPATDKPPLEVLRMFSQEATRNTESNAKPLSGKSLELGLILCVVFLMATTILSKVPIRTLGNQRYATLILLCLVTCCSLMLAAAWQLLRTWSQLRELLVFLDRTPLRRTLAALRGFSWGSVWTMSGNVLDVRYKLLSRQLESLGHTRASLDVEVLRQKAVAVHWSQDAQDCIAHLSHLEKPGPADDPVAVRFRSLASLNQMRQAAAGSLLAKLDAVRDFVIAENQPNKIIVDSDAVDAIPNAIEALHKFINLHARYADTVEGKCIQVLDDTHASGMEFAKWYAENYDNPLAGDLRLLKQFQISVSQTAGFLLVNLLLPQWKVQKNSLVLEEHPLDTATARAEDRPLPLSKKRHIRNAEEFVCLPYLGYVQNILGRMRTIVMSVLCLFVATAVAISCYPFDPRQGLSIIMVGLFLLLGAIITYVYASMHKDTTLSHVTNTKPGELGGDFWFKLLGLGVAPLLGLLTTVFPSISDFVFSWLQPSLQSVK